MWWESYRRSRPRAVQGGIKSQSKRGGFGESWWAKRWLAVLESFDLGGRLSRGRSYARGGQVLSIDITEGKVKSRVQGSRPKPYDVSIGVKRLGEVEWKKVVTALASKAVFAAKLLAGEMPQDVETVFAEAKLSLFPQKRGDLQTACSCPDYANPCKHVAAVYCLLGEEFDRDPFLIFKLRGLGRDELLARLGSASKGASKTGRKTTETTTVMEAEELPVEPATFWNGRELPADWLGPVQVPPVSAAWPRRLGNFPFWRGEQKLLEVLEPHYRQASPRGLSLLLDEAAAARDE
jgi:uncharacterized Zn finger protein